MRNIVRKCIIAYNLFAIPFVLLTVIAFLPESCFLSKLINTAIFLPIIVYVSLAVPFQNYLIPQIIAAVLIGLYAFDIIRQREFFPFRWERRSFAGLSVWTILSAVFILLACLALSEGGGIPLS